MNRKYRIDRCLWLLLATYSICLLMCRFVEVQFRRSYLIVKWKHAYFIAALYECVRGLSLLWSVRSSWCKCACWFLCKIVIRLMSHEGLTHKWLEMHGCVISTMITIALVLKHQAISSQSAVMISIVLDHFHTKILHSPWKRLENNSYFENDILSCLRVKVYDLTGHWTVQKLIQFHNKEAIQFLHLVHYWPFELGIPRLQVIPCSKGQ